MAIKCSNCGGELKYNIRSKEVECESCGFAEKVANVKAQVSTQVDDESAVQTEQIETNLYRCGECGAEIRALNEEATVFCPYCGKQSFLAGRDTVRRPDMIIPFEIDKRELKKEYTKRIKKMKYVPREMQDGEHIEKCTGIFIPHWSMTVDVTNTLSFKGSKRYTSGSYDYYEEYDVKITPETPVEDISFDASEAFDDTIASSIAPFNTDKAVEFQEGYIAGFYADKETVDSEVYKDKVEDTAIKTIRESALRESRHSVNLGLPTNEPEFKHEKEKLALFPVWFMTHRNKNRVSYIIANGQTGKMHMDVPIDKKAFFGSVCGLGIILSIVFVLLFSTMFAAMSASIVSFITMVLLCASTTILYSEAKKIYKKDTREMDIGNVKDKPKAKAVMNRFEKSMNGADILVNGKPINTKTIKFDLLPILGWICVAIGIISCLSIASHSMSGTTRATFGMVLLTIPFIILHLNFAKQLKVFNFNNKINNVPAIIATILCTVVYLISFVSDYAYYALAIACIVAFIYNIKQCIDGFDYLTSRPAPNFFTREEVDR